MRAPVRPSRAKHFAEDSCDVILIEYLTKKKFIKTAHPRCNAYALTALETATGQLQDCDKPTTNVNATLTKTRRFHTLK